MENLLYGKQIEEKHYDAQLLAKGMKKEKIRHYGFMSNSNRKKLLPKCRSLLNQKVHSLQDPEDGNDTDDTKCRCPQCNGKLILYKFKEVFKPDFRLNSS